VARRFDAVPLFEQVGLDPYGVVFQHPVRTVADIGANIGMAAVRLSLRYPTARFVCVEPDPAATSLLERNLWLNQVSAKVIPGAVVGAPGRFHVVSDRFAGLQRVTANAEGSVPGYSLAGILDAAGFDTVDLVKMDIEGAEADVFAHANDWAPRVRALIAELHDGLGRNAAASLLAPHGLVPLHLPTELRFRGIACFVRPSTPAASDRAH